MPASAPSQLFEGATFSFANSTGYNTVEIVGWRWNGGTRDPVSAAHIGTAPAAAGKFGNVPFLITQMCAAGSMELEFHFNPDLVPPCDLGPDEFTITFPTSLTTWKFQGAVNSPSITGTLGDKITGTITVYCLGEVTINNPA